SLPRTRLSTAATARIFTSGHEFALPAALAQRTRREGATSSRAGGLGRDSGCRRRHPRRNHLEFSGTRHSAADAELGQPIDQCRDQYFFIAPLQVFLPGLFIFFALMSFNLLGDALRDALDPRLAQARR